MSGYTLFNSNKSLASNCLALVIPFVLLDTIPLSRCLSSCLHPVHLTASRSCIRNSSCYRFLWLHYEGLPHHNGSAAHSLLYTVIVPDELYFFPDQSVCAVIGINLHAYQAVLPVNRWIHSICAICAVKFRKSSCHFLSKNL